MAQTSQPAPQQSQHTNGLAIASLITAFFLPVVGLILGIVALNQIKTSHENGHGLAVAGIIISIVLMAIVIIWVIFAFVILGSFTNAVIQSPSTFNSIFENIPANVEFNFSN